MAEALDIENLQDDELDAIMAQAEAEAGQPEVVLQEAREEVTHNEDTDLQDELDTKDELDEAEPNEMNDEDSQDNDEEIDEGTDGEVEENTQVEDSNLQAEDEDDKDTDDGEPNEGEESTDTKDQTEDKSDGSDGEDGKDTGTIDYKKQYEELQESNAKLQGFYDEVTSEFTANGKKMKGFTDPKKIIQSQQMAAGFSEKMSAFKPYRPFMSAIKEQGWLDDPTKFDMAVNLMNRDPEAIKTLIKDSGIDVLDMDMDNINYAGKQHRASNAEVVLDEVMASAKASGVESNIREVLGGQWSEDGSLVEVLDNPTEAQALVNHLVEDENGNSIYKDVTSRINEKLRTDYNSAFANKNSLSQYKEAANELEAEYRERVAQEDKQSKLEKIRAATQSQTSKVETEKAKIAEQRKEKEYKTKVEKTTKKVNDARKKAASLSSPKKKVKANSGKKFDPLKLNDNELEDFLLTLD